MYYNLQAVKKYLQETNPDRVPVFEKKVSAFVKKILENFKDYEFYVGESMNPVSSALILLGWNGCLAKLPRGWHYSLYYHL